MLIPLSRKLKTSILDLGLLTLTNNCVVDPVVALLVFARAHEIDWSDLEAIGRFFVMVLLRL